MLLSITVPENLLYYDEVLHVSAAVFFFIDYAEQGKHLKYRCLQCPRKRISIDPLCPVISVIL